MVFAFGPEDLSRYAIPIGIAIALVLILAVPAFRRSLSSSFKKGREARERWEEKKRRARDGADDNP